MSVISVSIVEDDGPTREILVGWIRQAPEFRHVGDYGTAEQALAKLPVDKPAVALVDINLPRMSGIECVRRLKPLLPETQFMMLTVYEDADHLFDALAAGATGYLLKQTSREELLAAIQDVQGGGSPMSSNIARKVVQTFRRSELAVGGKTSLTSREREVLQCLASGDLYKEIAEYLGITVPTVNTHIRHIYEKLHVRSRAQAIAKLSHLRVPAVGVRGA